jgi:uncharacterized repeat protein (TIGR01451 family)
LEPWVWIFDNPLPYSGKRAHQSSVSAGLHHHFFYGATETLTVNTGDILFTYVYIDPDNIPSQIMLQWDDGSGGLVAWNHRAYWGQNLIFPNVADGPANHFAGPLPTAAHWVRLEVPASAVGLEGHVLSGMDFSLYNGRVTWDYSGRTSVAQAPTTETLSAATSGTVTFFTAATLAPGQGATFTGSYTIPANAGCSITSTLTATGNDKCVGTQVSAQTSSTCPLATSPGIFVTQQCPATAPGQGGVLNYTGTVSNTGNVVLTNVVVYANNWTASNTVVYTTAFLLPGGSASFKGSYNVPNNCCSVWNTLTATGADCSGIVVTDAVTQTCPVQTVPAISVTKVCPVVAVAPGDILHYSGVVSNAGNIALTNVIVASSVPGTNFLGPIALSPGEAVPYYAAYTTPPDFCGTDTVTARGLDACTGVPVASSVTVSCPVVTNPRIAVTHSCPPQPTPKGGTHTFTGTVSNSGNVTLSNVFVVVNEPQPNTPVIGPITLAPGASAPFTGSYTAPLCCCEFVDMVTAKGQDQCSGATVTATSSTVCPLLSTPSLTVTRVCPTTSVQPGGVFTYTGVVSNSGDVVLTNVVVVSNQPTNNTPVLGPIDLAPGETEEFSGSYTVAAGSNPALDTVQASGTDICQARTVFAKANCSGPVNVLSIDPPVIVEGWLRITWKAQPGVKYCLQSKSGTTGAAWVTIPGTVTATTDSAYMEAPVESDDVSLYRVMILDQ